MHFICARGGQSMQGKLYAKKGTESIEYPSHAILFYLPESLSLWLQGCPSIWEPPHHSESVLCRLQHQSSPQLSHTHTHTPLPVAKGSSVGFWLGPFPFPWNCCDKTSRHPEWSWRLQKLSPVPSALAPFLMHPLSRDEALCLSPRASPPVQAQAEWGVVEGARMALNLHSGWPREREHGDAIAPKSDIWAWISHYHVWIFLRPKYLQRSSLITKLNRYASRFIQ